MSELPSIRDSVRPSRDLAESAKPVLRIKGVSIRTYIDLIRSRYGDEVWEQVRSRLDPAICDAVAYGAIVVGSWYPLKLYATLQTTVNHVLGQGAEHSRKTGRLTTELELQGIYKVFARLLSPESVLRVGVRLFQSYFDGGQIVILSAGQGHATAQWKGCHGFTEELWQDVIGGVETVLLTSGARHLEFKVLNGGGNRPTMTLEATWL